MLLLLLLESQIGFAPLLMWVTLALALYLAVVELRELDLHWAWWIWWLLLVVMIHFVGYLFLRVYAVYRRWNTARSG